MCESVGAWAAAAIVISLMSACSSLRPQLQAGGGERRAAAAELPTEEEETKTAAPTSPDREPGVEAVAPEPAAETPYDQRRPAGEAALSDVRNDHNIRPLPDFWPVRLPPFPWWALPIVSNANQALAWSDPRTGIPHVPILDNLFLLLKVAESCLNCTFFLSVDTPLLLSEDERPLDVSPANLRLLYYQVVPFRLPFAALEPLPLAFRIPSFLNGSYLLVTRSSSSFPRDNFVSLNYQRLLAPDLFLSDSMIVHGISGFLAPFTLAIPF